MRDELGQEDQASILVRSAIDFLQLRVIHIITKLIFDGVEAGPVAVTRNLSSLAEGESEVTDEFFRCR
jgi:hypothetical protein